MEMKQLNYRQRGQGVNVNQVAAYYALTLQREQGKAKVKRGAVLFWCVVFAVVACIVLLPGCHSGEHCVRKHTACLCIPAVCANGQYVMPSAVEECDEWAKDE